jgi:hypothetical protein
MSVVDIGEHPMMTDGSATATELMENLRAHRARQKALNLDSTTEALAFVAAGHVVGSNRQVLWRSDVMLANYRSVPQRVAIGLFAAGVPNGTKIPKLITLDAHTIYFYRDFVRTQLNETGLGSIIVLAVESDGSTPDTLARIDGSSRIYTTNSTGGSLNQFFPAVPLNDAPGSARAMSMGLRQDSVFRTNVGIANFDTTLSRTFTIRVVGDIERTTTVTVPPLSMVQTPIPPGNYGDLFVQFDGPASGFWWSAYAASVDGATSDGWSSHAALTF